MPEPTAELLGGLGLVLRGERRTVAGRVDKKDRVRTAPWLAVRV